VANFPHTAEDFAALYEEIAALVRAGLPLEQGLVRLSRELPRGAANLSAVLGEQLAAGRSLTEAIDDPRLQTPPVFRAALLAGVRSGRLADALEAMALAARRMSDLRRAVGLSLIYPTILLCLGLLQIPLMANVFAAMIEWLRVGRHEVPAWMVQFERLSSRAWTWWIAVPAVLLLLFLLGSALSGAGLLRGGWRTNAFRFFPWVRTAIDNARRAHFADQLALLTQHGVPLGECLRIAAGATGDPQLRRDALSCAEAVSRGQSLSEVCSHEGVFTPMLRWLMSSGGANQTLARSLRHAADSYQRRAIASADLARIFLPGILTAVIGGGVVATIGFLLMSPWSQLWQQIIR